jgi:hypothetical protein
MAQQEWDVRDAERMPDEVWAATLARVRGEFDEMPCMRVTSTQAASLLGLKPPTIGRVLDRLADEGFLAKTEQGEYMRAR